MTDAHIQIALVTIGSLITSAIVSFFSIRQKWHWPYAIFVTLVMFTCIMYLIDRFLWIPSEKATVRDWLLHTGYPVEDKSDMPDMKYGYTIIFDNKPINVVKRPTGFIEIFGKIQITPETQQAMLALP